MGLPTLTIETGPRRNRSSKSRTFSVHFLGFLTANALWEPGGDGSAERPIWLAYFGTDSESQPFTANLRGGKKARADAADIFEIPKRGGHRWVTQKVPNGLVTVVYLAELFHLEPKDPLPETARFVFAPPSWWIEEQAAELAGEFGDEAADTARAALFCAYLDRRTSLPLIHDLRFHLQVYRAALATDWTYPLSESRVQVLRGRGAEASGLDSPLACSVAQQELSAFLIEQTSLYQEALHGTTRIPAVGRLLSYPGTALAFPRLDSEVA
jgi:hypothetical protein